MLLLLLACQPAETTDDSAPIVDDGCAHPLWEGAWPFPDDRMLVADDTTATGLRLSVDPADVPLTRNDLPSLDTAWFDADGFSRIAPAVVQLDTAVDPSLFGTVADADAPVHLLGATGRLAVTDDGTTFTVWPDAALPHGANAIVIRKDIPAGTCFSGGPTWEEARRADDAYADAIDAALVALEEQEGLTEDDIAAIVPFTTRSETDEARTMDWLAANTAPLVTTDDVSLTASSCPDGHRWCADGIGTIYEGTLTLPRWQGDTGAFETDADGVPTQQGENVLSTWLMVPSTGPAPLLVLQHGLGGDKDSLVGVGRELAAAGFAVVAINAVEHGDRLEGDDETLAFFGIDYTQWQLPKARDNFRQTSADHLGVRTAILAWAAQEGVAIDSGDGAYLGQSLGGILGAGTCALDTDITRCALNVPGGRLVEIVRANAAYAALMNIYFDSSDQAADVELFSAMAQTIVDPADPTITLRRLFDRSPARPVLVQEAIHDGTVVNQTTEVLARSAGIPLLTPSLEDITGITTEAAPVEGNVTGDGGSATGGLTQFDAEHGFLTKGDSESQRAMTQILTFLQEGRIE